MSKIACKECGTMILESTYEKNQGLCFPCKNGTRDSIEENKVLLKKAKETPPEPDFICLECGSKICRSEMRVNPIMDKNDPWSFVTSRDECWDCGAVMPRELARRWNVNYEQAKEIWVKKYRSSKLSGVKNA